MMGTKARLGICAATAALAAVAVAGCSGSGSTSGAAGGKATTGSGGAVAADSASLSLVADAMNKADSAGTVKVTGTMTAPGMSQPMTLNAEEQYSPSLALSMSMQVDGQAISEVLVGDTIYMDYPELAPELNGKTWAEIDLSGIHGSLGSLSSLLESARNENPTTQIAALVASGTVSKVGTETVNGQSTTHYSGTLDASQVLKAGAAESKLNASQLSSLESMLQTTGVTSVKIDTWIASDGLPVQEKYSEQTSQGTVSGDLSMSDWGAPVSIGAPPSSDVYNMTSALNGAVAGATDGATSTS